MQSGRRRRIVTAVRPGDRATLTVLAMEAELTALGLLRDDEAPPPLLATRGRKATQPHGTYAGFQRHRYAGEQPCEHCADAEHEYRRAYQRARRAARKAA
jgi:hypothetical protein